MRTKQHSAFNAASQCAYFSLHLKVKNRILVASARKGNSTPKMDFVP